MPLDRYLRFGAFYVPVGLLASRLLFETLHPHPQYNRELALWLSYAAVGVFILATSVLALLALRRRDLGRRATALMFVTVIAVLVLLAPLVYTFQANKSRLQAYVEDLRRRNLKVRYHDYYAYGHWTLTWIQSYVDFVNIAHCLNDTLRAQRWRTLLLGLLLSQNHGNGMRQPWQWLLYNPDSLTQANWAVPFFARTAAWQSRQGAST